LNVRCESKTKDNVFVHIEVSVQYKVIDPVLSYYKLDDSKAQIRAYVFDVIRSEVPKQTLDQVFEEKENLSRAVQHQLEDMLKEYGFQIRATPVTDIDPDHTVKRSLNQMNEQKNLKDAMREKAESDAIVKIRNAEAVGQEMRIKAEADAEAKYQAGLGLSRQRKAIVDGLSESVQLFQDGVPGVNSKTVMDLIMITQYFDMMEKIGCTKNKGTNALFIPNSAGGVHDFAAQLRQGMMEANAVASAPTRMI
jgi:regulator of protease activity HflC (stomatin/prohibitin superfamily)